MAARDADPLFDTWRLATIADPDELTSATATVLELGAQHTAALTATMGPPFHALRIHEALDHRAALQRCREAATVIAANRHTPPAAVASLAVPVTVEHGLRPDCDVACAAAAAVAAHVPSDLIAAIRALTATNPRGDWRTLTELAAAITAPQR